MRDLPACVAWEVAGERSASMRGVGGSCRKRGRNDNLFYCLHPSAILVLGEFLSFLFTHSLQALPPLTLY